MIVQLITAFLGSLGFALVFNERRRLIFAAAFGGLLGWAVYLLLEELNCGTFFAVLAATAFVSVYSEVLARRLRLPSTVIFIPAAVPLVPGGSLYYTMQAAVNKNETMIKFRGSTTLQWALAIALGLSLVKAFFWAVSKAAGRSSCRKGGPKQ